MKVTLEKTKGYSLGRNSGKTWVAKFTESGRSFLVPTEIDYGADRAWFRKNRATRWDSYETEENGLYEVCELGARHFRLIFTTTKGTSGWLPIDEERARKIIAMLEAGSSYDEARNATKKPKDS